MKNPFIEKILFKCEGFQQIQRNYQQSFNIRAVFSIFVIPLREHFKNNLMLDKLHTVQGVRLEYKMVKPC